MNSIFSLIAQNSSLFARGLVTTILLWVGAALMSISIGVPLGILSTEKFRIPVLYHGIRMYVMVLRAVPLYVQLLIVYFVLPDLLGIRLSAQWAAIIALGVCSSAYVAEIVHSGIQAIPNNQWDAGFLLGYTKVQSMRYTILPQAFPIILPALTNEFESIIKSTAIVSTIGVLELTRIGNNIVARTMNPIPIYCCIALLYLVISLFLMACIGGIKAYCKRELS